MEERLPSQIWTKFLSGRTIHQGQGQAFSLTKGISERLARFEQEEQEHGRLFFGKDSQD